MEMRDSLNSPKDVTHLSRKSVPNVKGPTVELSSALQRPPLEIHMETFLDGTDEGEKEKNRINNGSLKNLNCIPKKKKLHSNSVLDIFHVNHIYESVALFMLKRPIFGK